MPHLSYVERALARTGSRGLLEIPLQILENALEQLDGAVLGSSTLTLDELRARLERAIEALRVTPSYKLYLDFIPLPNQPYGPTDDTALYIQPASSTRKVGAPPSVATRTCTREPAGA